MVPVTIEVIYHFFIQPIDHATIIFLPWPDVSQATIMAPPFEAALIVSNKQTSSSMSASIVG